MGERVLPHFIKNVKEINGLKPFAIGINTSSSWGNTPLASGRSHSRWHHRGASCPNNLIEDVINHLLELRNTSAEEFLAN